MSEELLRLETAGIITFGEHLGAYAPKTPPFIIAIRCRSCGSVEVSGDDIVNWNAASQAWEANGNADRLTCEVCGDESRNHDEIVDDGRKHECQNCGWVGDYNELGATFPAIIDLVDRIVPGEPVPSGECPRDDCGGLCHLYKRPE